MAPPNIKPDQDKLINFRLHLVVVGVLLHLSKYKGFSAGLYRASCAIYFSFFKDILGGLLFRCKGKHLVK